MEIYLIMNDNILLIAPSFYGYYKDIISELERRSFNVVWYDDQIEQSITVKIKKKIALRLFKKDMKSYLEKIITENKAKRFKYVIIILGYDLDKEFVEKIKTVFRPERMIYYTWDSVTTYPQVVEFLPVFDDKYSFDDVDCKKYNLHLLPLYCKKDNNTKTRKEYDCTTVMSYFPNKDKNIRLILNSLPHGLNCRFNFYVKSVPYFFYLKLRYFFKVTLSVKDITTKRLSLKETYEIFEKSIAVIDCPIVNQCGLTMRTFEVLSKNIKLITTNQNIKKYDFYNPANIAVVEKDNSISKEFFSNEYSNDGFDYWNNYGIETFINVLLGIETKKYLK